MPKISVYKVSNGSKVLISEKEVSQEKIDKVRTRISEIQAKKKERMQKMMNDIPEIHWEILGYSNEHNKEQVLLKYPEHKDFINSISFK